MASIIKTLVGAAALAAVATSAQAITYRVEQEQTAGGDDFATIGIVNAYVTTLSASGFYQFGNPQSSSYNGNQNGGPETTDEGAVSFLVKSSDGLSFVTILDSNRNEDNDSGSENVDVALSVSGDPDGVAEQVQDEGSEFGGGPNSFTGTFSWARCCSDGLMVGALDGLAWTLLFEFTDLSGLGKGGWTFADGSGGTLDLADESGRAIRVSAVPVPAGVLLIGSAFALAGAARRVSRKA